MRDYPAMATEFPGQVQCILLRNTSNSDPGDRFPYDTSGFKDLDNSTYMFFVVPVSPLAPFPKPPHLLLPSISPTIYAGKKN